MPDDWSVRLEREVSADPARQSKLAQMRGRLRLLRQNPPQTLILEGGTSTERESLALWWTAGLNCCQANPPCLSCKPCRSIFSGAHPDLYFLAAGHMSILIEQIRAILSVIGEAPRGEGYRTIILADAHMLNSSSANSLLKVLEEPRPNTSFILLSPQRERILPTLVSRAMALTLPWPEALRPPDEDLLPYLKDLADFAERGLGWLGRAQIKGAAGKNLAERIILQIQRDLLAGLKGQGGSEALEKYIKTHQKARESIQLDRVLDKCRNALDQGVNPTLVMDYLALKMHLTAKKAPHPSH